jgi:predicted lysophospholipase L1 biosynthesis ABC-type transport system permease subunit
LIRLGVQNFQIEGLLTELPTASFNFFSEGRTIVIPYEAIAQTELTQL